MTRHGKAPVSISTPVDGPSNRLRDITSITADTSQRSGDEASETTFAGETVQQIEATIESFRTGNARKSQIIFKISQILAAETTGDEQLKADSLERYISTLEGIEAIAAQSDQHGMQVSASLLGKRKEGSRDGDQ